MGTYYIDNDVGLSGGSGTQQDPYGIESAIAAAQPGDVFYWRGGGEGDVFPGHALDFSNGGSDSAPVRWIGTDDNWNPIPIGQNPQTGVDGEAGAYHAVTVTATHQMFESIRVRNTQSGRNGPYDAWYADIEKVAFYNCIGHSARRGFFMRERPVILAFCTAYDAAVGFYNLDPCNVYHSCLAYDVDDNGLKTTHGITIVGFRVYDCDGPGIELARDQVESLALLIDHSSVHACTDGVKINSPGGTNVNEFTVTNCIFDTCSGYAVNVTAPSGHPGVILNNGSFNCASGQVPSGLTGLINEGWIALPASPYADASVGDLSLIRRTPARGAAADGGDLGALQRKFARLPYPAMGLT